MKKISFSQVKWLYPGMKVKRWLLLMSIGVMLFAWGLVIALGFNLVDAIKENVTNVLVAATNIYFPPNATGIIIMIMGFLFIAIGIRQLNNSLWSVLSPSKSKMVDLVYQKRHLERGLKILVIGGGTGLSTLLRGLKKYTSNITVCVSVADDGGSSGKLRRELGLLPPGDLRNCIVALADSESSMTNLFQYRFKEGSLEGQNFGNLLIAAMTDVAGDFAKAIEISSTVLAVRGKVLPATLQPITLCAEYDNGEIIEGESNIPKKHLPIKKIFLKQSNISVSPKILNAIKEAEAIIVGPGSLYTSLIPNLLLKGMLPALKKSKAVKIFICNVMTQPGETDNFSASTHLQKIIEHENIGENIFDYVVVNNKKPAQEPLKKYQQANAHFVEFDEENINKLNVKIISGDFIDNLELVRHNPEKLSKAIISTLVNI